MDSGDRIRAESSLFLLMFLFWFEVKEATVIIFGLESGAIGGLECGTAGGLESGGSRRT